MARMGFSPSFACYSWSGKVPVCTVNVYARDDWPGKEGKRGRGITDEDNTDPATQPNTVLREGFLSCVQK